jgi:hypothetical protein
MLAHSFSPQYAELEAEQDDLGGEEVHALLEQARTGRAFLRNARRALLEIIFIIEGVAQVSKGLKKEKATLDAVHLLAQTAVLDAIEGRSKKSEGSNAKCPTGPCKPRRLVYFLHFFSKKNLSPSKTSSRGIRGIAR